MESKDQGLRYNTGKRQWSLVDFKSLESMVQVLEYGAHKYSIFEDESGNQYKGSEITVEQSKGMKLVSSGRYNWQKGMPISEISESLLRHTFALLRGEVNDPESGLPHIGHIQCNAMFIGYMMEQKPEFDNLTK